MKGRTPAGLVAAGAAIVAAALWLMWKLPAFGRDTLIRADEAAAIDALRRIHDAELEFRRDDGDGNGVPDFWTGDVSGLYRAAAPDGQPCAFLDGDLAAADRAPLAPTGGGRPRLTAALEAKAHKGYWLRALPQFARDGPDEDANAWENLKGFGFAAFPAEPGVTGKRVFLIGEDGVVWAKEGAAPEAWPAKGPEAEGWKKAE